MKTLEFYLKGRTAYLKTIKYSKKFSDLLSYSHPAARFSPAYNTKDENGNRLWDGRASMVKYNALPVGLLIGAYKELKEGGFKAKVTRWKNRPHIELKKGFWEASAQYGYQNDACKAILSSFSKGGGTVLSATGSGKTKLAAQCFSHIQGSCLFIVDQINLLYQSQKEISEWLNEEIGIIGNGKFQPKRVTVATIQTLFGQREKRSFAKWSKNVVVICVDELHKQMNKRNFDVLSRVSAPVVIGLTATLQMKKKLVRWKVYSVSGPVIFSFPLKEGQEKGVLSKAAVIQVNVPSPDLDYHHYDGDMRKLVKKMVKVLEDDYEPGPNREYVKHVVCNFVVSHRLLPKLVKEALHRKLAVVVLAERIRHVRLLRDGLAKYNPRAVYGAVKETERQKIARRFERGKYDLIIASSVFTKGVNLKRISLIIDVAQRPNKNDAMQKLGRGVRLHNDKAGLIFISVVTNEKKCIEAGNSRRNAFKKAGVQVKILDWEESDAKEVLQQGHDMLKME